MIAVTAIVAMLTVEKFVDDIEKTILDLELEADANYFKGQLEGSQPRRWKTGRLEAIFAPDDGPAVPLPDLFRNKSAPYSNEIEIGEKTFLVLVERIESPPGQIFLAQDITIMENREALVQLMLLSVAVVMLLIGHIVSRVSSRRLVKPLRLLAHDVQTTEPGLSMQRLSGNYRDREFEAIAQAFNRFLTALESHIEREKSFVKLASHELRTPLAVISGALEILEQRQSMAEPDRKTLARIRNATRIMQEDVDVLLQLARGKTHWDDFVAVDVQRLLTDTIADLANSDRRFASRTTVSLEDTGPMILSDPALVRMLLRNLLQNALRHTTSEVEVRLGRDRIRISDSGSGMPASVVEKLSRASYTRPGGFQESSFGLLIVQLICERLGWNLEVEQSNSRGTRLAIHFGTASGEKPDPR